MEAYLRHYVITYVLGGDWCSYDVMLTRTLEQVKFTCAICSVRV